MRKKEEVLISFGGEQNGAATQKSWSFVYEWLDSVIYAVILLLLIFTFLFRVVGVSGTSMYPTLDNGDWLTVNSVPKTVERGDIVVITQPNSLNEPLIKRVIAKGGDTISIDFIEHTVTVNGTVMYEPYINEPTARRGDYVYPLVVPDGCIFVMGDNRNASLDSRFRTIGMIDERYVLGVAQIRVFPFGDWTLDDYE